MDEAEHRQLIVDIARSWVGTPYISNGKIKGKRGGVDCAMILLDVYQEAGLADPNYDPRPYSPQWHLHRGEEIYLNVVLKHGREFDGPPKPGDVVMYKIGRLFAHGGIVTDWPKIVQARAISGVMEDDVSRDTTGRYALANLPPRFFSFWES